MARAPAGGQPLVRAMTLTVAASLRLAAGTLSGWAWPCEVFLVLLVVVVVAALPSPAVTWASPRTLDQLTLGSADQWQRISKLVMMMMINAGTKGWKKKLLLTSVNRHGCLVVKFSSGGNRRGGSHGSRNSSSSTFVWSLWLFSQAAHTTRRRRGCPPPPPPSTPHPTLFPNPPNQKKTKKNPKQNKQKNPNKQTNKQKPQENAKRF